MPYKYIGRTTDFRGNTLWEIVGNLKNFGIGRIVVRNRFQRYPEPSYMKILKVETLPNPKVNSLDDVRKVKVWVERTFRGVTEPKPVLLESATYKADYQLIPKDEEERYCEKIVDKKVKILPKTMRLPPLLRELVMNEQKTNGESNVEEPRIEIVYRKTLLKQNRVANDGETPDFEMAIGLGKPASPSLYKGIGLES